MNADSTTITGLTMTATTDNSAHPTMQGTITAAENVYYPDQWASGVFFNISTTTAYSSCPTNYWFNQNKMSGVATLRFQIRLRFKLIVDDVYQKPPMVKTNFPDLSIVVGKRYNSPTVTTYF